MTRAVSGINAILKVITRRNTYIPRMYVKIMSSSHEVETLLHDVKIYFSISNHIVQDAQSEYLKKNPESWAQSKIVPIIQ